MYYYSNCIRAILIVVASLVFMSCHTENYSQKPSNPNAEFYNTEWSSSDYSEGIRFYNDDTCLSFADIARGRGTFSYNKYSSPISGSIGCITFYGLENNFPTYTCVIDYGFMLEDGTMKMCWRYLGEEKGHYNILYRRK